MIRRFLIILLLAVSFYCTSQDITEVVSYGDKYFYSVNTDVLNVRTQPSLNSNVIGKLKKGNLVASKIVLEKKTIIIDGIKGEWALVSSDFPQKIEGYVFSGYLRAAQKASDIKEFKDNLIDFDLYINADYNKAERALLNKNITRNNDELVIQTSKQTLIFSNNRNSPQEWAVFYLIYYNNIDRIALLKKYWYDSSHYILVSLESGINVGR